MQNGQYQILSIVKALDEADIILKEHNVTKYRTSNLSNCTKYSYRCSSYRKYPLCKSEIKIIIEDIHPTAITLMYKNIHYHEQRNTTTRAPSPVRKLVSKYVNYNFTETQIKNLLTVDCPTASIPTNQLSNLINYARRKNNPEIFSKLKDTQFSTLLQVDATYKLTWNELPLLVFGSSDADRHFRPFGVVLVSSDENSTCYIDLFRQLKIISTQENQREYSVNYVMADGVPDNIFSYGTNLLMKKWSTDPLILQFQSYFFNQWITALPLWYEGAAINMPLRNNGCESLNAVIKKKYTMRNKFHLSSFLPEIKQMLEDWSIASSLNAFVSKPSISSDLELCAFKWSNSIDKLAVLHWFDSWYIVPSSDSLITPAIWLQIYQLQQWTSFDKFVI